MAKALITAPNEIVVRVDPLIDYKDKLVSGELTEDGIQYSEEVTTGEANVEVALIRDATWGFILL